MSEINENAPINFETASVEWCRPSAREEQQKMLAELKQENARLTREVEALKAALAKCEPIRHVNFGKHECVICGEFANRDWKVEHKPDCLWLQAQEVRNETKG